MVWDFSWDYCWVLVFLSLKGMFILFFLYVVYEDSVVMRVRCLVRCLVCRKYLVLAVVLLVVMVFVVFFTYGLEGYIFYIFGFWFRLFGRLSVFFVIFKILDYVGSFGCFYLFCYDFLLFVDVVCYAVVFFWSVWF